MKPHKHAALIKAWADGAEMQYRNSSGESWRDCSSNPAWCHMAEYRIKPKTIKYRLYLDRYGRVQPVSDGEDILCHFVKWLGDWQVVEI